MTAVGRAGGSIAGASLALAVLAGCASTAAQGGKGPPPVVLPDACRQGPHCVAGQIDDQYGTPIPEVRCIFKDAAGRSFYVLSDARGLFFVDRLMDVPREVRFEKVGYAFQTLPVPRRPQGSASRIFATLRKMSDADCSCQPDALVAGKVPCPEEQCR